MITHARALAGITGLLLPLGILPGCASAAQRADANDNDDNASSELAGPCTWGTTCPDAIQVAFARDYGAGRPPARYRSDIAIAMSKWDKTPRVFQQRTTRELGYDGTSTMMLGGDTSGTQDFAVDNVLLIEVLGLDGALLDAAYVGAFDETATIGGKQLRSIAAAPAWAGDHKGFPFGPKDVDISSLLPKDKHFKLRFSALDNGGQALVTDIWARKDGAVVKAVDPFDATNCAGAPITRDEAVSMFAPTTSARELGVPTVHTRVRTCSKTTGCADWSPSSTLPYRWTILNTPQGAEQGTATLTMPESGYDSRAQFVVEPKGALRLDVGARYQGTGFVLNLPLPGEKDAVFYTATWAGACSDSLCTNATNWARVAGGTVEYIATDRVITNHCFRLHGSRGVASNDANTYLEYETVVLGTY